MIYPPNFPTNGKANLETNQYDGYRIFPLAANQLKDLGTFCEKTALAFFCHYGHRFAVCRLVKEQLGYES